MTCRSAAGRVAKESSGKVVVGSSRISEFRPILESLRSVPPRLNATHIDLRSSDSDGVATMASGPIKSGLSRSHPDSDPWPPHRCASISRWGLAKSLRSWCSSLWASPRMLRGGMRSVPRNVREKVAGGGRESNARSSREWSPYGGPGCPDHPSARGIGAEFGLERDTCGLKGGRSCFGLGGRLTSIRVPIGFHDRGFCRECEFE